MSGGRAGAVSLFVNPGRGAGDRRGPYAEKLVVPVEELAGTGRVFAGNLGARLSAGMSRFSFSASVDNFDTIASNTRMGTCASAPVGFGN